MNVSGIVLIYFLNLCKHVATTGLFFRESKVLLEQTVIGVQVTAMQTEMILSYLHRKE